MLSSIKLKYVAYGVEEEEDLEVEAPSHKLVHIEIDAEWQGFQGIGGKERRKQVSYVKEEIKDYFEEELL